MRTIFAASLLGFGIWTTSVLAQTAHGETAGDQSAVFRGPSAPVLQPAASTDVSAVRRRRAKARARARTELRILRSTIRSSETRRRPAAERARDTETLRRSWPLPGLGIELYADLGGSFGLNAPRLDNFGQTLERKPGIYGAGGIVLSFPLNIPLGMRTPEPGNNTLFFASAWDVRVGGTVVHSASETTRVLNDTGQFLRTKGHHDTTAALALLGLGVRPFAGDHPLGRFEFTFDGGLGHAFHNVSVFGPGGNQVIRSNDSSLAWMLRGAAIYQVTDYVGIGAFVSHFQTDGVTAFLANGNPFALGGRSETIAGVTLTLRALQPPLHSKMRGQIHINVTPE